MRKAAADASGANTSAIANTAPNKDKAPLGLMPIETALTAPAPNTNTGIYSGNTKIAMSTPLPRIPSVRAAPILPIRLKANVPINKDIASICNSALLKLNCKPISGATKTSGKPESTQCANSFISTINTVG